jgi:hypothetical protein
MEPIMSLVSVFWANGKSPRKYSNPHLGAMEGSHSFATIGTCSGEE